MTVSPRGRRQSQPKINKLMLLSLHQPAKVIVRRYSRKFDAAVGDDYSIIFIVVKPIRLLVHFELERVQLGMSESPGAQPDFLTVEVKTLRRRDIGIVRSFCA